MPRRRQPQSLKRLCMKMVAKYFEAICYPVVHPRIIGSADFKKWLDEDIFVKTKPHFGKLDSAVLEELLGVVSKERNLQKHHVHMLMTKNTNRIKLGFGVVEDSYALRFLRERAQYLQHLDLSSLHHLNPQLLIEAISSFPCLVTLNLSRTSAVNQVVATVGKYCPEIEDLDISFTDVTDKGILSLIHGQGTGRQAQRLSRLNVRGLELNPGTLTFIIQNLPNLFILEAENLFSGFKALRGKKLSIAMRRTSSLGDLTADKVGLSTLISSVPQIDSVDILTAIQMCPLVTKLVLTNAELEPEDMAKFALIQNLTCLEVVNRANKRFLQFSSAILPLLRMKGHQLESISLSNFDDVCVKRIGALCTNLKRLCLLHVDSFELAGGTENASTTGNLMNELSIDDEDDEEARAEALDFVAGSGQTVPFSNLEEFEVTCEFYGAVPKAEHLLMCLADAKRLKTLLFKACLTADDKFFVELLKVNPLPKLQKLALDFCPISTKTARRFLDLENDLHHMTVCDTGGIDLKSSREITILAHERNLDLYIEWSF